jgi:hypothetical protein
MSTRLRLLDAAAQCRGSEATDVGRRTRSPGRTSLAIPGLLVDEKVAVRSIVFGHLAGIVLAPVLKALADRGVFDLFPDDSQCVELDRIMEPTHGNRGYLRVALRLLSSYGWLRTERVGNYPQYKLTRVGVIALRIAPQLYATVVPFLSLAIFLDNFLSGEGSLLPSLEHLVPQALGRWGLISDGTGPQPRFRN